MNIRHSRIFRKTFHMPHMSSMDATYHDAQDIIYALQNPSPAKPLLKLGHGHKKIIEEPSIYIHKRKILSRSSEGASQEGRSKETPRNKLGGNPNEKNNTIKSSHQYRTS